MSHHHSLPEISEQIKRTWQPLHKTYSAGGIAYRFVEHAQATSSELMNQIEVALIATRGGERWQLPKGTREKDETSLQTAIREVEEEVGLLTSQDAFLKTIEYWYWDTFRKIIPDLVHKQVDFYLLRVIGGELSDDSYEVDGVGWFTLAHAMQVLTFKGEQAVLQLAIDELAKQHPR